MRITTPTTDETNLMAGPGDIYAPEISAAGNAFARAIYEHSRVSLRVFEAARIATANIKGCLICKNWRAARDVGQLGIDSGVIENGQVPDETFYQALLEGRQDHLDERERLAVEYANAMGESPKALAGNEVFWEQLKTAFSDAEITDLTYCVAGWMGMGRVFHVLGMDGSCAV
jgi:alkylhydroperoxidase family enzyme